MKIQTETFGCLPDIETHSRKATVSRPLAMPAIAKCACRKLASVRVATCALATLGAAFIATTQTGCDDIKKAVDKATSAEEKGAVSSAEPPLGVKVRDGIKHLTSRKQTYVLKLENTSLEKEIKATVFIRSPRINKSSITVDIPPGTEKEVGWQQILGAQGRVDGNFYAGDEVIIKVEGYKKLRKVKFTPTGITQDWE